MRKRRGREGGEERGGEAVSGGGAVAMSCMT